MRVIILGATGMLGSCIYRYLRDNTSHTVIGTYRTKKNILHAEHNAENLYQMDVEKTSHSAMSSFLCNLNPDLVINCLGVIKQSHEIKHIKNTLLINSILPQRLSEISLSIGAKLLLFSTDCVFSGKDGGYIEQSLSDINELYGSSKYAGEVIDRKHVITLRTSMIGHEIDTSKSLLDWFLSQRKTVKGFKKAYFSGPTTLELAKIIKNIIIPRKSLSGLFHISSGRISKHDLLQMLSREYHHNIGINSDYELKIDRSLDSSLFSEMTGYQSPDWEQLIKELYQYYEKYINNNNLNINEAI